MKLEFYSVEKLKKEILEIVIKYLNLNKYKVFFFGSRVSGKNDEYSDIDVGIEGPEEIPTRVIYQIKEDIEDLPILYKIEVVDFYNVSSKFKKVASQHLESIILNK